MVSKSGGILWLAGLNRALGALRTYLKNKDYFVVYSMLLQFAIKSHNLAIS